MQVHEIEHIPESLHSSHSFSFVDVKHTKSPLELAVDQCEICIHGSALDDIAFIHIEPANVDLTSYNSQKIANSQFAFSSVNWPASLARAPPVFFIS